MANKTVGIELCDAGFQAARANEHGPEIIELAPASAVLGWPGFAHHNGSNYMFGVDAEGMAFIHPRSISALFWENLSHDVSDLHIGARTPPHSELAFHFLRDFHERLKSSIDGAPEKVALAVPGRYLEDAATEEERIGLLLGMASELQLPLVRVVDMACAALAGPIIREFPRNAPIIHVDVHLHAAELTLLRNDGKLSRQHYVHLPQVGYTHILRQLKNTMGNRFLRQTAFDIHDDRKLEQAFYDQTKAFLLGSTQHAHEFIYEINTTRRSYQLTVPRTQLVADLQPFEQALVQAAVAEAQKGGEPATCALSLTDRAARLDGLETRLRAAGFTRIVRLRPGAAAMGAALLGEEAPLPGELADVPVEISVPPLRGAHAGPMVETSLVRPDVSRSRPAPSHVILEGIGYALNGGDLTIGTGRSRSAVGVALPEHFDVVGDFVLRLVRDEGQLWLQMPGADLPPSNASSGPRRTAVEAGDRLALRGGGVSAELLFAYCPPMEKTSDAPHAG